MLRMAQEMTTTERVALRVGTQITESGVRLTWLCEQTGIPRTTLHRLLKGQAAFNLNQLDAIAEALRIPATVLLDEQVPA